ncbi:MAG: CMP-N,N'-diacetyllegionaminic acid synthase [Candidatus Sericytochromatia bacterium]|nr:MAG: CMP-N,N'-diacetyllegionaminic acid synthase [Candidatus Sericytochromatia bacterium]
MREDVICTICARGGSKGVKNKNIKLINNKPLIAYTIEQAIESKLFYKVVVSSDSDEIINISVKYGAEVFFKREENLANDEVGKIEVIRDAFLKSEKYYNKKFNYLVDLDVTSPLRNVDDIINAFNLFIEKDYDNLFSVNPSRRNPYFNIVEFDDNYKIKLCKSSMKTILTRQSAPKCYDVNASIYIWKRDVILNNNDIFLDKTGIYIMPYERSIDIDDEFDFEIVSYLINKKYAKK